jgi:superfamily II DNA helicase RecQ
MISCELSKIPASNRRQVLFAGGGKSLSYQLVSQMKAGLTLVVCPLVSLMHDQVSALRKLGITADMLTQNTDKADLNRIMAQMSGE